jgi:hypothetical protein
VSLEPGAAQAEHKKTKPSMPAAHRGRFGRSPLDEAPLLRITAVRSNGGTLMRDILAVTPQKDRATFCVNGHGAWHWVIDGTCRGQRRGPVVIAACRKVGRCPQKISTSN